LKSHVCQRGHVWQENPDYEGPNGFVTYVRTTKPAWSRSIEERMKSGRKNKSGTPRLYAWEDMYRIKPDRRRVCQGDNINFICQYLYENPGARYTEIMRALCKHNRATYSRGMYSDYFSWNSIEWKEYPWFKCGTGWLLTPDGMVRAVDSQKLVDYNRNRYQY